MRGGGTGFVHDSRRCAEAAAVALRREAARREHEQRSASKPEQGVARTTLSEARACSVVAKLEKEYALSDGRAAAAAGGLLLPRHDRNTFIDFVRWLASSGVDSARSLELVAVAGRPFSAETRLENWGADREVAALLEQLLERAAMASEDE